jgi:hypothetical protein
MPIDSEPHPDGTIELQGEGLARVVPKHELELIPTLYLSHFASCPQAAAHRRKKES